MSIFGEFVGKLTSCFGRKEDEANFRNIRSKIKSQGVDIDLQSDLEEDSESQLSGQGSFNNNNSDNTHFYNFKYIYEVMTTIGINLYKVKNKSYLSPSNNKIVTVNFKYDCATSTFLVQNIKKEDALLSEKEYYTNKKIRKIKVEKVFQYIYGNLTSNFKLLSSKLDVTPWRCFSLIDNFYESFDFICERDDDIFYILIFLEILHSSKVNDEGKKIVEYGEIDNKNDRIRSIISKMYWKKAFMKIKFYN